MRAADSTRTTVGWAVAAVVLLTGCTATQLPETAAPSHSPASESAHAAPRPHRQTPKPPKPSKPPKPPRPASTARPGRATAAHLLSTLLVRGRAPMTGYDRDRFGQAWLDADRNGCDTRNDILRRDLVDISTKPGSGGCVVLTGDLADPYTGTRIAFVRGQSYSVDIDHVVALGNAWVSGAWRWDVRERAALANDPLNLLAVDAGANRSKGDGDAATWLPPHKAERCAYVARQVTVKAKYHLSVTAPERDAVARVLTGCPRQPVAPDPTHAPTRVEQHLTDPGAPNPPAQQPKPRQQPRPSSGGQVYYANCDAARAAGAAPVHAGDPGYSRRLDRDGDGVGCE